MSDKKLSLSPHKYGGETTVISMRLPKTMLADIDDVAAKTGRTRNEILTLCMEYALVNIEISDN